MQNIRKIETSSFNLNELEVKSTHTSVEITNDLEVNLMEIYTGTLKLWMSKCAKTYIDDNDIKDKFVLTMDIDGKFNAYIEKDGEKQNVPLEDLSFSIMKDLNDAVKKYHKIIPIVFGYQVSNK